jgi:hypothetical protein
MKPNHLWIFPDVVSDETAVALSKLLRYLARECDRRYATELRRHRAAQRNPDNAEKPWRYPHEPF